MALPKVVFGVEWVEVEPGWGTRPEGWKISLTLEEAKAEAKRASAAGPYENGGGYCGPVRPLYVQEILTDDLPEGEKMSLETQPFTFTANYWMPKWIGPRHPVGG